MYIAVVDDNENLAKGIKKFFGRDGHEIDVFHTKYDFMKDESFVYDIYIMDINLPDGNGLEITKELRNKYKIDDPILMISANGWLETKLEWFNSWVDDYIVKPFSPLELQARIQAIINKARGMKKVKKDLEYKSLRFDSNMRKAYVDKKEVQLTKEQKWVLEYFMLHQDTPIGKMQVAEHVWGSILDFDKAGQDVEKAIQDLQALFGNSLELIATYEDKYILENPTQLNKKITLDHVMG